MHLLCPVGIFFQLPLGYLVNLADIHLCQFRTCVPVEPAGRTVRCGNVAGLRVNQQHHGAALVKDPPKPLFALPEARLGALQNIDVFNESLEKDIAIRVSKPVCRDSQPYLCSVLPAEQRLLAQHLIGCGQLPNHALARLRRSPKFTAYILNPFQKLIARLITEHPRRGQIGCQQPPIRSGAESSAHKSRRNLELAGGFPPLGTAAPIGPKGGHSVDLARHQNRVQVHNNAFVLAQGQRGPVAPLRHRLGIQISPARCLPRGEHLFGERMQNGRNTKDRRKGKPRPCIAGRQVQILVHRPNQVRTGIQQCLRPRHPAIIHGAPPFGIGKPGCPAPRLMRNRSMLFRTAP